MPSIPAAATFASVNPVNTSNKRSDNKNRVYYANNGTTYFSASGDDPCIWEDQNGDEVMRLKQDVTLGIDVNPDFRLHVAAASGATSTGGYKYFYGSGSASTSWVLDTSISFDNVCAKFNSSIWINDTIISSSDIRIKKNIEDINDDSALQKILDIQPKTFNYIDVVNRGEQRVYGFITQQINEVLPEAVRIEIIPNIYEVCDCS